MAQTESLSSTASLVAALRKTGATVLEPDIQVRVDYFSGTPNRLTVNGGSVLSFEYPSAEVLNQDALRVSKDGSSIGSVEMNWGGVARFYKRDRVIVLYLGDRYETIRALEAVLGRPFAGPRN
jgi:hypothetical protein